MTVGESEFDIRREDRGNTRYLYISGELDMPGVSRLLDSIEGWENLERLIIDATDLTFLESGGLATLVAIRGAMGADAFELIAGKATQRLLDLTGTGAYLGVDPGGSGR